MRNEFIHLQMISDLLKLFGLGNHIQHPLIAIIDFSKIGEPIEDGLKISSDFYSMMFKSYPSNKIKYGRKTIDFQDGSLICMAPNQVIEIDNEVQAQENAMGWGLFFHPDLIRTTSLNDKMREYSFFSYETSEALHLSEKEKQLLYDCVLKLETELKENIDMHSQAIIVSTLELLLSYCTRFYGRQFITRKSSNNSVIVQIEKILTAYFKNTAINENGLPTVKYLADRVNLSPGYLSDLLKKETGKNTLDHIHFYLIEEAKNTLLSTNKSVSEIAYALGFDYPQYFNKLFKQKTGKTPIEFRVMNS
ncbi:AraC-like DNA-binding protein [Pedobacter cryoconitis]|uniref:AraC-like DNA-binding protein n=1 Tax=Pedobacter cryoconitis TaxID=188932 RepID=A0A7W8ZNK0_9SPHI|nr:response regulator transcription factor [Pedobacter cryoconitis]MBB5637085.1 AraC-like DNA-binding protein [Pedobacter cryoconitis]MBB6273845.1 AraC-like DNA-binding protein [Pedobacter cryoconitis]